MTLETIVRSLKSRGCSITQTQATRRGRLVFLVQPWNVAMFQEDIADVLSDSATVSDVVERNKGADLADPWLPTDAEYASRARPERAAG